MTESKSEAQDSIGMRFILSAIALFLASSAFGEGSLPIKLQTISVDKKLARSLKDFAREEAKTSNSLSVKKIVKWNFGGNSGDFLLVNTKTSGITSCIIYIKDRGMYRSLGGNDNCTWKKTPKLVWKDEFAWIEFPASPQGRTSTPVAHNCPVSCDHIPRRSWALFRARDVMRGVIESLKQSIPHE